MEHRVLGRTGISVSKLCLGAMMFAWWGEPDEDVCAKMVNRALDAGINFIDTADVYSSGQSEEFVGSILAKSGVRDQVVLATKVNGAMGDGVNQRGNSRRWIMQEVDNSLRRLRTDWIDLYQVHRPDPSTDIEETLSALTDLVRSGKVRAVGSSTFPAPLIVEAQWAAQRRGLERFTCEQPPYSLLVRGIEAEVLPACARYGMGAITWSPLAGGWLTGRYRAGQEVPESRRAGLLPGRYDMSLAANQRKLAATEQFAQLADEAGMSLIELALAFILRHPAVTSSIVGPRTMEHLESQLTAADIELTDDVLNRIDEIVPPGVTLNPDDAGWQSPALADSALRRR
jgi:aryl-alcohol dehydrogenase-like predicted oxidoreductase